MKRILYIIFLFLVVGNLAVTLYIFRIYKFDIDGYLLLKFYYEGSIYALKCGAIGVVVDWISKDWFKKK
ncbi:hypothetical protein IFE17_10070 [Actinobacillus sp. GY-402]|nr:hypothetical protein IFE17_10070 [Actinobacillus sp. GY-402]